MTLVNETNSNLILESIYSIINNDSDLSDIFIQKEKCPLFVLAQARNEIQYPFFSVYTLNEFKKDSNEFTDSIREKFYIDVGYSDSDYNKSVKENRKLIESINLALKNTINLNLDNFLISFHVVEVSATDYLNQKDDTVIFINTMIIDILYEMSNYPD